ncbi:hypothetical protein F444_12544, partial [Phytophthora nicotianae P1976]
EQAAEAVNAIFSSISAYDVRPLDEEDVFLDVGAGVGNILAQVALTTDARLCVGIEFRRDLVSLGQRSLHQQLKIQPRMDNVMEWGSQNHVAIHSDTQCPGLPTDEGGTPLATLLSFR